MSNNLQHINKELFGILSYAIVNKCGRKLHNHEKLFILEFIYTNKLYKYRNISKVIVKSALFLYKQLFPTHIKQFDMHEYLTETINTDNVVEIKNRIDIIEAIDVNINTIFNDRVLLPKYEKNYIMLDNKYCYNASEPNKTQFKWLYIDTGIPDQSNGIVTTRGTVKNLIAMKLYQFMFPVTPTYDFLTSKLSIFINEFAAEAIVGSDSKSYHWIIHMIPYSSFSVAADTHDSKDGVLWFRKPITYVDSFTLIFGNPTTTISLPYSYVTVNFTYGVLTTINILDRTLIVPTTYPATVVPTWIGYIYFTNFTTANPVADATAINNMNYPAGVYATMISSSAINVAIDTSAITPIPGLQLTAYLDQFNFNLIIETTCLVE